MNIALVGASNNPAKYGNKILKVLQKRGDKVFPINPKGQKIEGLKSYKNLSEISAHIDIVNFVVPPQTTLKILKECKILNLKKIWCQPGTTNDETLKFLKNNGFDYIVDACIMMS